MSHDPATPKSGSHASAPPGEAKETITCVDIVVPHPNALLQDEIPYHLWEMGITGFEQHDAETFSLLVEEPYPLPKGAIRWRLNLEHEPDPDQVSARFQSALSAFEGVQISVWTRDITGYRTAWMQHFRPTKVSPRIVIHPPWDAGDIAADLRINIDPGMAFGTGTHETTRLCLRWLDTRDLAADRDVLDVGTGSGVLSIAAAKLGARSVVGIDIDPDAVREAKRNAQVNGCADRCQFETSELSKTHPAADLVIANILPRVLLPLSGALIDHVRPGGTLLLSGILQTEADRIQECYTQGGMAAREIATDGEWCAIVFEFPP